MLMRVGSCEAEVKVVGIMSTPRLGFTDNFFCCSQALSPHGITIVKHTGAYFGQCLTRSLEQVMNEYDVALCIDYDTVFTAKTVEALITLLYWSGYDAVAPLQTKRESSAVMFALPGVSHEEKTSVGGDFFDKVVQPVDTAHFGLTPIKTEALRRMEKPWMVAQPSDSGDWNGGHVDEDIVFWRQFQKAGNKLGCATQISVGHAELMITWPSREADDGKVQQHTTDFWNTKKPHPKAWGVVA